MIVEHQFVTTLEIPAAMAAASAFLAHGNFVRQHDAPTADPHDDTRLEMHRGEKRASRAKSVADLPQRVIVEFDRGRVRVAAMITVNRSWGGSSNFMSVGFNVDTVHESPKKMELHQQLLVAIANGLERSLTCDVSSAIARAEWLAAETAIAQAANRRKRQMAIIIAVLSALAGLVIFAALLL